jgi:phosphatidylserine/phosphatidylglycerophosphate/cardiolipin synthase-like enzyme
MKPQTKEKIYIAIIIVLIATAAQFYCSYKYQPAHKIEVYYNQDRPLNLEVINTIKDADKFVYFAVYTFTRQDILSALLGAKYRGLKVVGITDKNQYQSAAGQKELINQLRQADIPVYEQDSSGIMHMKALVTEKTYLSGSYNWTSAATNINDEILEVGHDPAVRSQYQNVLEEIFKKYAPQT